MMVQKLFSALLATLVIVSILGSTVVFAQTETATMTANATKNATKNATTNVTKGAVASAAAPPAQIGFNIWSEGMAPVIGLLLVVLVIALAVVIYRARR